MKKILLTLLLSFALILISHPLYAPWIWTPDNGWMNEKDMVLESPKSQWKKAEDLENQGDRNKAIRAYQALVKTYPTSPLAPKAQLKAAELYEQEGLLYDAFLTYQKLLENYPKEIDFENVLERQYNIGSLFVKGKKRNLWRFPILPARDKGIEILEILVKNAPYSDIAPDAQFYIATAYKRMGKYTEAIEAYEQVTLNYKDSPLYEEALYQMGWCNYKKSRGFDYDQLAAKESIILFNRFIEEFPDSNHTPKIKTLLGDLEGRESKRTLEIAQFYDKHGHKEAAIMYYNKIIEKDPDSEEAKIAIKRLDKLGATE